jgi:hypothetical protein
VEFPAFVTHYHLPDKAPFLNLSELREPELSEVLEDLEGRRRSSQLQRIFGRRYMELRRLTEARLHELFVQAGGKPERRAPHYFVLGASSWYRGLALGTQEVVVALSTLPFEVTSFTYPDSFTAMGFLPRYGLPYEARPHHQRVFRMDQLLAVIERYGLPADEAEPTYDGYQDRPFEKYLEVQLWSDQPIRELLDSSGPTPNRR